MTNISFYHLLHQPLTSALPKLLEKVHGAGLKAVIKVGSGERLRELDDILWSYDNDSFLPHGSTKSKFQDQQPIFLTTGDENPGGASVLVLVDGVESAELDKYDRCLELFDGTDQSAVTAARARWKSHSDAGHDLTYWQQTEQGGWRKKG